MIASCLAVIILAQNAPNCVGIRDTHNGAVTIQLGRLSLQSSVAILGDPRSLRGALSVGSIVSPSGSMLALSLRDEVVVVDLTTMRPIVRRQTHDQTGLQWDPGSEYLSILNYQGKLVILSVRSGRTRVTIDRISAMQWTHRGTLFALRKGKSIFQETCHGIQFNVSGSAVKAVPMTGKIAFRDSIYANNLAALSQEYTIEPRLLDYADVGRIALFLALNQVDLREERQLVESIPYSPDMKHTVISVGARGSRKWTRTFSGPEIIFDSARVSDDGKLVVFTGSGLQPFGPPKVPAEKAYVATVNMVNGALSWRSFDDRGFLWLFTDRPSTNGLNTLKSISQ